MARQKKPEEPKAGSPEWMSTYGDLVTLLLCFFVLLYSMSNLDQAKYQALAASFMNLRPNILSDATGGESIIAEGSPAILEQPMPQTQTSKTEPSEIDDLSEYIESRSELGTMASDFKTYFAQKNLQNSITVTSETNFIRLQFKEAILFDVGKAQLKTDAYPILEQVGNELAKYPDHEIRIEGHTDSDPINTVIFPSNMYLSAARAISVFEYLVDETHLDQDRIAPMGWGEYKPVAPNDTPENKAKNRRVEITIYSKNYSGAN